MVLDVLEVGALGTEQLTAHLVRVRVGVRVRVRVRVVWLTLTSSLPRAWSGLGLG